MKTFGKILLMIFGIAAALVGVLALIAGDLVTGGVLIAFGVLFIFLGRPKKADPSVRLGPPTPEGAKPPKAEEVSKDHRYSANKDESYIKGLRDIAENLIKHAPKPVPGLGFYNMPKYSVAGKNSATNRKKTLHIRALNPDTARKTAETQGLIDPITVEEEPFREVSGVDDYGFIIPDGACYDDIYDLDLSVSQHDSEPIPPSFMAYLTGAGIPCSWLSGRNQAMEHLLKTLSPNDRAALFGYAAECSISGRQVGDISDAFSNEIYMSFSEMVGRDSSLLRSLAERPAADYWTPSKRSAVYKFAEEFFSKRK